MRNSADILISVHKKYVLKMLAGEKTVELRRRPLRIEAGTRVWIYSKQPSGKVEAIGIVEEVVVRKPSEIWSRFRDRIGVSSAEFDAYFSGIASGCAIVFKRIVQLSKSVSLADLRLTLATFHPPQFFKRLYQNSPELTILKGFQVVRGAVR